MVRMGKTRKAVESKKKEKIKTPYAKIIVEGKNDYPYYSIVYYDTEKKEWMNGFGSYNRHYVFDWFKNEFEVTMEADCFPVIHGRWLWHDLKEDGFTTCQGAWAECSNWTVVNKKDTIFKYIFWERLDSLPIPESCFHFVWCQIA